MNDGEGQGSDVLNGTSDTLHTSNNSLESNRAEGMEIHDNSDIKSTPAESESSKQISAPQPEETEEDEDEKYFQGAWRNHSKHVFILSSSGRPVYSRYGDELKLCGFMGVLQATISIVSISGDTLNAIIADKHKIVFLLKGPLYFVLISKTEEPISQLKLQLEYIYSQIISTLTSGVNKIYESRDNFDIRGLLGGTEKFISNLIRATSRDSQFILNATRCLRLPSAIRNDIGTIMQSIQTEDLVYAILLARDMVVNLVRPRRHLLHSEDLHLVVNFINSSASFRSHESWTPLCLPKFNDRGYLHAYVCYLAPDVCLLLISTNSDNKNFYNLADCKTRIEKGLAATFALDAISKALRERPYTVSADVQVPGLLHFLYKNLPASQYTSPALEPPYSTDPTERKRLFRLYQNVRRRVMREDSSGKSGVAPHKVYYQRGTYEMVLAWVTNTFELYAVFSPDETKATGIKGCNKLLRWLQREEDSLFILQACVW